MLKKWILEKRQLILQASVFEYWKQTYRNGDSSKKGDFDYLDCHDWANVLAITPEQKIVMVKQFRFGLDDFTLETPGGVIHGDEDPLMAAQRELKEECGYTAPNWKKLGAISPNPAFMNNLCHYYLALGATKSDEQNLDPYEEIEVEEYALADLPLMAKTGKINHSIVLTGFYLGIQEGVL